MLQFGLDGLFWIVVEIWDVLSWGPCFMLAVYDVLMFVDMVTGQKQSSSGGMLRGLQNTDGFIGDSCAVSVVSMRGRQETGNWVCCRQSRTEGLAYNSTGQPNWIRNLGCGLKHVCYWFQIVLRTLSKFHSRLSNSSFCRIRIELWMNYNWWGTSWLNHVTSSIH